MHLEEETDLTLIPDNMSKSEISIGNLDNIDNNNKDDDNFMIYMLKNYDTINSLTTAVSWFQFLSLLFLLGFVISLDIRAFIDFNVFIITTLLIISIIFLVLMINFMIKIKMIIDSFENEKKSTSKSNHSSIINLEKHYSNENACYNTNNLSNPVNTHNNYNSISNHNLSNNTIIINNTFNSNLNHFLGNNANNISHNMSYLTNTFSLNSNSDSSNTNSQIGSIISLVFINLISINFLAFIILLSIKLNESTLLKIYLVTIPLLISLSLASVFFLYILPGLLEKRHVFEIIIGFSCSICLFAFAYLLNKKEFAYYNINVVWMHVGSPLLIVIGILIVYVCFNYSNYSGFLNFFSQFLGLLLVFTSALVILLRLDERIYVHYGCSALMFNFGVILIVLSRLIEFLNPPSKESSFNNETIKNQY